MGELAKRLDYRPITVGVALARLANDQGLLVHNGKHGRASAYDVRVERFTLEAR